MKKTAIVTGGTKGIGLGIVKMLAGRGYRVFTSYGHDAEAAEQAMHEMGSGADVTFIKANHSIRRQTYRMIEHIREHTDAVHCIICNAGITVRKPFEQTTDDDWDQMMETSVNAHLILLRELYALIQPGSRIVFTGSAMGLYPHATVLGYGVAKSAVHALVKNLTKVLEPKQATVNAVAPGFVETEWQKDKPEEIRQNIYRKTAIHRFASIEETVKAFEFCIDNAFVNGSIIEVNGGYSYK